MDDLSVARNMAGAQAGTEKPATNPLTIGAERGQSFPLGLARPGAGESATTDVMATLMESARCPWETSLSFESWRTVTRQGS